MTRIHRRYGLLALAGLCATSLFAQTPDWPKAGFDILLFSEGDKGESPARALFEFDATAASGPNNIDMYLNNYLSGDHEQLFARESQRTRFL